MPRKKTKEQKEFAKTVEYRKARNGAMRPTKYAGRKQETQRRSNYGTGTPLKVVKIDAALYDYIVSHKGDTSILQYTNQLIRKAISL